SESLKSGPGIPVIDGDDAEPVALSIALVGAAEPVLRAIGQSLARGGADLVLIDSNEERLASTRAEIEAASEHSQVLVQVMGPNNAANAEELAAMISSTIESLDAVVVFIGDQSLTGPLSRVAPEAWQSVLNSSLIRLSLAVTALTPALQSGSAGTLVALSIADSDSRSKVSQVIDAAIERYVSLISKEMATANLSVEMLRTSPDPFTLFGATTTHIVETIRESAARKAAALSPQATEQAAGVTASSGPEKTPRPVDDERESLREKLGAMYRRRSNAMQKKRELGDGWTPRFEAAYQEILGEIAQLEQQMGLPPSQTATSLRTSVKPTSR
ncbi:MAG TPA: SDR family NAD(P)-dependent oxidoreductase, partial [Chloroflexota bacterium]|nr:SDR family NAD(P)-dependent oxidoreductase [Chloroflexota bacterium]